MIKTEQNIRGSSNGRTAAFEAVNLGSIPSPLAMLSEIFSVFTNDIIWQALSAIATFFTAICAYLALKQISIAKEDIEIRSKRESISCAVDRIDFFRKEILIDLSNSTSYSNSNSFYRVRLKEFVIEEIDSHPQGQKIQIEYNRRLKLANENETYVVLISDIANKIESFAIPFVAGVADEKIAFNPLAEIYCEFVENHFYFYSYWRKKGSINPYENTIKLYTVWVSKTRKHDLIKSRENIDKLIEREKGSQIEIPCVGAPDSN